MWLVFCLIVEFFKIFFPISFLFIRVRIPVKGGWRTTICTRTTVW